MTVNEHYKVKCITCEVLFSELTYQTSGSSESLLPTKFCRILELRQIKKQNTLFNKVAQLCYKMGLNCSITSDFREAIRCKLAIEKKESDVEKLKYVGIIGDVVNLYVSLAIT